MVNVRILLLLIGAGFLYFIIRQLVNSWIRPGIDKERYREKEAEEEVMERRAGGMVPVCPLCGNATKLHRYPHIIVWRCIRYPSCRGFVKAQKPGKPKFAEDWRRKGRTR